MSKISITFSEVTPNEIAMLVAIVSGKTKKPVVEEPEEEEPEEEEKKPVKKTTKKPVVEEEEPEEEEPEEEDVLPSIERVYEKCQQVIKSGKAAKLKALLTEFGFSKVAEVKAKNIAKFWPKLVKIK